MDEPAGDEGSRLQPPSRPVPSLTWFNKASDVVWPLGVGWHELGGRDDAYEVLKDRDRNGELMPDERDYLNLEISLEETNDFLHLVAEEASVLLQRAQQTPGTEVRAVIAERLSVGLLVGIVVVETDSAKEIWVALEQPPALGRSVLPSTWPMVVLAALLPTASLDELRYGGAFPRPGGSRANEIVVSWCTPWCQVHSVGTG